MLVAARQLVPNAKIATAHLGLHLLRRPAADKHGAEHYAIGVPPAVARELWGDLQPSVLELTPRGVERRYPDSFEAWTIVATATDLNAAVFRLRAALAAVGAYSLTANNCEHFARQVVLGRRESTQVDGAVTAALSLAALLVLASLRPRSSC